MLNILASERHYHSVVHVNEKFSLSLHLELREPAMLTVPVLDAGHCDNILEEPCKTDVMHKVQDCTVKHFRLRLTCFRVAPEVFYFIFCILYSSLRGGCELMLSLSRVHH